MTWPTHALFGISTLWLLAPLPQEARGYDMGVLAAIAVLGALLPDLDASESKIKHLRLPGTSFEPFLLPAQIAHRSDRHRELLHSLAGLGMIFIMTVPTAYRVGWAPAAALLLGYGSHLLADSTTKTGILLFYPRRQRYYLLPSGWRIATGSMAEELVFAMLIFFVLLLLLRHFPAAI